VANENKIREMDEKRRDKTWVEGKRKSRMKKRRGKKRKEGGRRQKEKKTTFEVEVALFCCY
jgi:hypothetical protein